MNGNPVEHKERENRAPSSLDFVNKITVDSESYKLGQNNLFKHIIPRQLNSELCYVFQTEKVLFLILVTARKKSTPVQID